MVEAGGTRKGTYKFHISSHLSNLAHLHHDELVHLRIALFVVPHLYVGKCANRVRVVGGRDARRWQIQSRSRRFTYDKR